MKVTTFYLLVYLFMDKFYLSLGFIPCHNHLVCCCFPSGVIFSHVYVMAKYAVGFIFGGSDNYF